MAPTLINVGDLIKFKENLNPYMEDSHSRAIEFRALKDELAIVIGKGQKETRFRVYTSNGAWAEVTNNDVDLNRIEILASGNI